MSIDQGFKKMLEGVKQADEGRDEIMRGPEEAWAGGLDLEGQVSRLRESVAALQALIMEQGEQMKALRARLNGDK
jgi:hypothetical protein